MMNSSRKYSTGKLGGRSHEVRPVAAWVESHCNQTLSVDPMKAALRLEQLNDKLTFEKRLRQERFKNDLLRRVRLAAQKQQEQSLHNQALLMKVQTELLQRLEKPHPPWKNTCRNFTKNKVTRASNNSVEINKDCSSSSQVTLNERETQLKTASSLARHALASRRVIKTANENGENLRPQSLHLDEQIISAAESNNRPTATSALPVSPPGTVTSPLEHKLGFRRSSDIDPVRQALNAQAEQELSSSLDNASTVLYKVLCRKMYAQWERDWVRQRTIENKHRQQATRVKHQKELDRLAIEERFLDLQHAAEVEEASLKARHRSELQHRIETRRNQLLKDKRNSRFLVALKNQLLQRVQTKGLVLPALCSCHADPLKADPSLCANNCPFYKKSRAFAAALQNVVAAQERAHMVSRN